MTPAARLAAAIDLCRLIAETPRPADSQIAEYFRQRRYAGSGDRRAISDRVFGLLRRQARLGWWIGQSGLTLADPARATLIADLMVHDGLTAEACNALFDGSDYGPPPLDEKERALAASLAGQSLDHPDMPRAARCEIPGWLDDPLYRLWGSGLADEAAALNQPAMLDLRVNRARATRDDVRRALAAVGIEAGPTPFSPDGLRITEHVRLPATSAFRQGLFEVQDEGSQIVATLCTATAGMTVVDFCAGAGGKTLALAAHMGLPGDGRLIACDVAADRLDRMTDRLDRAGLGDAVVRRPLESERDPWIAKAGAFADRVLIDAPCTGTGTWRRQPTAKWHLKPGDLPRLSSLQDTIMENACRLVKPGGRMIYATCSVLPAENEERIERFLRDSPRFRIVPVADVWNAVLAGECPVDGPFLRLTPYRHGTDGFFAAILARD